MQTAGQYAFYKWDTDTYADLTDGVFRAKLSRSATLDPPGWDPEAALFPKAIPEMYVPYFTE